MIYVFLKRYKDSKMQKSEGNGASRVAGSELEGSMEAGVYIFRETWEESLVVSGT
jgi:hypothetical protein